MENPIGVLTQLALWLFLRRVPEGVCPLVPAQLTSDAVSDRGHELSAQAELGAELQSELLRRVFPL